jgi:hypothetical protein
MEGLRLVTKVKQGLGFWLDGGYDRDLVYACEYAPDHRWWTFRLGDVVENCHNPDESMTICRGCFVPRCIAGGHDNRCTMPRHHESEHVFESGAREPVGGTGKAW